MSKQINIGGRIHSTEVGNVAVGANEVLDDTKGKKQNVINSETDAELVRLDQAKQNVLTFDNTPTEGSNNPVKSDGVFAADKALRDAIEAILLLIPTAATALNKLADKNFVNSSISTATASFKGTYNLVSDLGLAVDATRAEIAEALASVIDMADDNDYAFVQIPVSADNPTEIESTERYKFDGSAWSYEYTLNTSGFTAAQWDAINSGITQALVTKLGALPTASELAESLNGLSGEINGIKDVIPTEATTLNQLADKAYVLAQILAATPAFKGQFTTLTELEAVTGAKNGDFGIVRTKDHDGKDVFTFYQYKNDQWNEFYMLAYHPQDKPATTGIIGSYPFNGMGRVELPMNLVDGWPNDTWLYLPVNGVVYLLYSWNLQLYAVYNSGSQEGLGLENNIVIEPANYNIADIAELVGSRYLSYTEAGDVFTITKPDTTTITSIVLNNTTIYKEDDTEHHGINILTKSMLNRENTIYVIQYDFTLGEDITVPANCVLEFDGGSVSGAYTITGNNTCIQAGLVKIFNTNITLAGTWNVAEAYPEWFGAKGDGVTNDRLAIQKCIDIANNIKGDNNKVYAVDSSPYEHCLTIKRDNQSLTIKLLDLGNYNTQTSQYRGRGAIFCDSKNGFAFNGEISSINDNIPVSGGSGATLEMYGRSGIVCYGDCAGFDITMSCSNLYCGIFSGVQNGLDYISRNGINGVNHGTFNIKAYRVAYPIAMAYANNNQIKVNGDSMHRAVWLGGSYNTIDVQGKNYYADSNPAHVILFSNFVKDANDNNILVGSNYNTITYKELEGETALKNEMSIFMYQPIPDDTADTFGYTGDQHFIGNVLNAYCCKGNTTGTYYIFRSPMTDFVYTKGEIYVDTVLNVYGDAYKYIGSGKRGIEFEVGGLTYNFTINNYTKQNVITRILDNKEGSKYNINGNQTVFISSLSGIVNCIGNDAIVYCAAGSEIVGSIYVVSKNSNISTNSSYNYKHIYACSYNFLSVPNSLSIPSGTILSSLGYGACLYIDGELKPYWFNSTKGLREADGAIAFVKRSGTFAERPTSSSYIYEGFQYMINDGETHIPIFAHLSGSNIIWYKADGTVYTQ